MIYIRSWYITRGWVELRLNKYLIWLLFPTALIAQSIFLGNGKQFAKVVGQTKEPKIVVQRVSIVSGIGVLKLNDFFTRERHDVSASADTNMCVTVTGILEDTSKTVYYYSVYKSADGDSLIIKSSSVADTSTVDVQIILK